MAGCIEPDVHLRSHQMHFGGTPFAAHQRAEREDEAERARPNVVTATTDFDIVHGERGRRQKPRFDRAVDPHIDADQMTRFCLEQRPVTAPVDQQGTDQRR
jgi:hypothetical protein